MCIHVKRPQRLYSPRGTDQTFLLKHTLNTRACVHQHTVFIKVTTNSNNVLLYIIRPVKEVVFKHFMFYIWGEEQWFWYGSLAHLS